MRIRRSIGGIFCDDIRQEVSGKLSLIGCYTGGMQIAEFPAALPKLCIHVRLITSMHEPFREVKILVLNDQDVVIDAEVPAEQFSQEFPTDAEESAMAVLHAQFVLSPFVIKQPCSIKVRAIVDGEEIRGLSLDVSLQAPEPPAESGRIQRGPQ